MLAAIALKHNAIPVNRRHIIAELLQTAPPKIRPCTRRRFRHRRGNLIITDQTHHLPLRLQQIIQPRIPIHIAIFQILTLHPEQIIGIIPRQILRLAKTIDQPLLRHPIAHPHQIHRIAAQLLQHIFPRRQNPIRLSIAPGKLAPGQSQKSILNLNRRNEATARPLNLYQPRMRLISSDILHRRNRILQPIIGQTIRLNQIDHQRRCTHLKRRNILRHIRIAHNHMQPAIARRICVGFIACIDNRTLVHRIYTRDHLKKLRALRQLINRCAIIPLNTHLASPTKNLARCKKRQ